MNSIFRIERSAAARGMPQLTVRKAAPSEHEAVLVLLTAAFEDDPAARALYTDRAAFRESFPGFIKAFAGPVFERGVVDRSSDGLGAALWLPPGIKVDEAPVLAHLEATFGRRRFESILPGLERQSALHPEEPHWYLPFIGVHPLAHGCGIGSHLLRHGLARADAQGLPAYLEATSARSLRLYGRYGFEVIGVVEAPDYPEIFAMWRPARRTPVARQI